MAVGRGSPANLISEITNQRVLHHLNLISVACKDHDALLLLRAVHLSVPPFALLLQVSQDQIKEAERAGQTGVLTRQGQENVRHGRRRSNGALNECRFITRGWQWAGCGGLDGSYL